MIKTLQASDWDFLTGKMSNKVETWQGFFLASAEKLEPGAH
jgi:hypothetical protein